MNKRELHEKLKLIPKWKLDELKISLEEMDFLLNKIKSHKIGLTLNFEEKDEALTENYFVLKDNKQLGINVNEDGKNHLLIEGDNYYALKALQVAGQKVDVIYIDPPYNTGKEFIYNDDFSNGPKVVGSDDPHKHSKWLSFMKKRLILAKELLTDDGVIFVSIDDNEQAYLKVLMDEIFGESNFIVNLDWISKPGGQSDKKYIATTKQYILMYKKTDKFIISKKYIEINKDKIYGQDKRGKYLKSTELNSPAGEDGKYAWQRINLSYHVSYNPATKDLIFDPSWDLDKNQPIKSINRKDYFIASPKKENLRWRWNEKGIREKQDLLIFETFDNGMLRIFKKQYVDSKGKETHILDTLILGITQSKGTIELKSIFNKSVFDYPKPSLLIKELIKLHPNKKTIVLDFFAGSGTTAQAVMGLNEEDNGKRKFILCTNNESSIRTQNEKLTGKILPELGIAQSITRERLFRVINGIGSKSEEIKWQYSKDKKSLLNNSVRYLNIHNVDKIDGEFEEIDSSIDLYKAEFNKKLSIEDFE